MRSNRTGSFNTGVGAGALLQNTGVENTAIGAGALLDNTSGASNTATGESALFNNTIGNNNTANGASALATNATGSNNTATGVDALWGNIAGSNNTAAGIQALLNTRGGNNTAIGANALFANTIGSFNIALGSNAGSNLTTGNNNIDIGYNVSGTAGESGTICIGDPPVQSTTYVAGISGAIVPGGVPVIVDTSGHLGTIISSQRFKDEIKPMDKVSEVILGLKPVTFRYKKDLDPQAIPQFGLVAEEVVKVSPDLVVRDPNGDITTVRYEAVNAMLLNEFLKEHRKVEEQEATLAQLKNDFRATVAQFANRLDEQAIQIQKMTARLEASKVTPQVVFNKH